RATNRAQVKASTTSPSVRHVRAVSRDATTNPSSANGSANTVCGSLTKFTQRTSKLSPTNVCPSRGVVPPITALYRPLPPRSIPRSLHISSTLRLVSASMTIFFGHSRVNPSSFHLRVASIPIFEPNVKPRLEWSSTSIGPIVNRTSRSGSMWFNATHHASLGSRTLTSLSSTTITLASDMSPCPHSPFITL